MQNLAYLAPLMILFPSIGAFINFFWGNRLGERYSAIIGTVAAGLTFPVALALLSYLNANSFQAAVINPPFLNSWILIPSAGVEIGWNQRVDTLSVSMLVFISFVGTLIHLYASSYMHGDPRFPRFFAYLNMFLAFMYTLVTGNNFLMMFVGWEGVGLCSYLLIGFWWDKTRGEGWRNANAARKAFIANRIGDFGVLMAIFLIFWTFGTLDFYKPTEVANVTAMENLRSGDDHHGEGDDHSEEGSGEHEGSQIILIAEETEGEGDGHGEGEGEGEAHGAEGEEHGHAAAPVYYDNSHLTFSQLGVFNQTIALAKLKDGETLETGVISEDGIAETRGRMIDFGPFSLDIHTVLILITLFLLLGAAGKSAQIPLFVWLPDAMAGPTPVSALIHAATMVTAGVYIMVRSNVFLYYATIDGFQITSLIITIVGATTAIVAGFIAIGQFDIKRVLAYSTVSQLGFMVAAVGMGAYAAAMFHMITHAFFKALLFLGSGSVIHGVEHGHHHGHGHDDHGHGRHDDHGQHHDHAHGEHDDHSLGDHNPAVSQHADAHDAHHETPFDPQDMRNMGGLSQKMPITYWTYLIGTLALAGIYPFAGFWSKDEILADAWKLFLGDGDLRGVIALGFLIVAAGMTAFYMGRQIEMVFHGKPRTPAAENASENPWQITVPLMILAFFSLFVGFINIPSGLANIFSFGFYGTFGGHALSDFLDFSIARGHPAPPFNPIVALTALAIGIGALVLARLLYGGGRAVNADNKDPLEVDANSRDIWRIANRRMYWDEIYNAVFIMPYTRASNFLANVVDWNFFHDYFHDTVIWKGFNSIGQLLSKPFDLGIIDGIVNGVGRVTQWFSGQLRRSQTGYVRIYAIALLVGVVAVVLLMLLPAIGR
jgi:NADH-quinone oxidoreductase subunit L